MRRFALARAAALVLLVALAAPLAAAPRATPRQTLILRVYFRSAAERDRLLAQLDVPDHGVQPEGYLFAYGDQATLDRLRDAGYRAEVDQPRTRAEFLAAPALFASGYRTVEEVYADMDAAVAAHPNIATVVDAGDSWCKIQGGCDLSPRPSVAGYDLRAMHITNHAIAGPKPVSFWIAAHHPREIHTTEIALRYIHWLLDNYGLDADATWLVDYYDIWVIPLGNPDGHKIVEEGGDYPLWQRKNLNVIDSAPWSVCGSFSGRQSGVDLNRNHDFHWRTSGTQWSDDPCSDVYAGAPANGGGSEPELRGYTALVGSLLADQRGPGDDDPAPPTTSGIFVSIHSGARWILIPYDWRPTPAPNDADLQAVWDKVATWSPSWPSCQGGACYGLLSGTAADWAYGTYGVPAAIWEIGEFMPSYSSIDTYYWPFLRPMMIYTTRIARAPYLEAHGPDLTMIDVVPRIVRPEGPPLTLTAIVDDSQNGNQPIAAAELYVDRPPWAGGTPLALAAGDGAFDHPAEALRATLDVCALPAGRHTIFMRGQDSADYWGPLFAAYAGVCTDLPPVFLPLMK